jgi:2-oxoglutarate dehydrogenase E2 component (dihydrolipoamide succinyltransferase)
MVSLANSVEGRFYSPLVLNIAKTEGIGMAELDRIPGSGKDNRVTKADILKYVEGGRTSLVSAPAVSAPAPVASAPVSKPVESKPTASKVTMMPGDEIIEMDRMRKIIADHMVMSKSTSPHVTSFVEADVTNLVQWREKIKSKFEKKEGEKITFTPIFIEAVVKAIKDFPMINISLDGTNIVKRKNINIGMAAALPSGNLIVPVIKNADTKNLLGLVKDVNDLARRARENKLTPDEISGGTYTITNVGTFGNVMGTPIINQPQVAILAVGAIRKKPAVLETEYGDVIAIRHMMFLSHSYDHRVVDGALGGAFVRRVADYLEQWDVNREV